MPAPLLRLSRRLPMLFVWIALLFLLLPVLVVIPVSLTDKDYLSLPDSGLSFAHYRALALPQNGWTDSFAISLALGICASAVSTVIAAAFAIGAWLRSGWWPSTIRVLMLAPMIVPPIIYAVAMVRVLSRLSLLDSFPGVLIVHVVLGLPMALLAVVASLANLDRRIVLAARSLGARPVTIYLRVIVPGILPGLGAALFLAFISSWDEITVTLFITARRIVTLPRRIYTSINDSIDPALAALATVLLIVTATLLIARLFAKGRAPGSPAD